MFHYVHILKINQKCCLPISICFIFPHLLLFQQVPDKVFWNIPKSALHLCQTQTLLVTKAFHFSSHFSHSCRYSMTCCLWWSLKIVVGLWGKGLFLKDKPNTKPWQEEALMAFNHGACIETIKTNVKVNWMILHQPDAWKSLNGKTWIFGCNTLKCDFNKLEKN